MLPLPENRFKAKASTTKDTKAHEGKHLSSFLREPSCPSWFNDFHPCSGEFRSHVRVRLRSCSTATSKIAHCVHELAVLFRLSNAHANCYWSAPLLLRLHDY